mgnify:FL=1
MSDSKLFNFSTLLTENTFNLVKLVKEKNYLSEALNIISSMDEGVQISTKSLYSMLLEAESKKEENACFGKFYAEYKTELMKYKNKMNELASQFCVNLETFADANKDILEKCCCCPEGTTFQGAIFTNLLSDDIPNIDPYKAFKKEWAFLGRLFQDLDPTASDEEKTKIIATVYNSLSKEINEGWLDKCVEKISGNDECKRDAFAKVIYDSFVSGGIAEITLDTPTIEQSKLALKNYTNYVDCISKSADDFCNGIDKIACEIGSMMFRNADKKFVVNTDEEGVADATYRMSDYSMNQINLFLTTKLSQIRELVNLYTVALSIKMDCIYKYFKQCVAMINASCCPVELPDQSQPDVSDTDFIEDDEDLELPTDNSNDDELPTTGVSSNTIEDEKEQIQSKLIDDEVDDTENDTPVSDEDSGDESIEEEDPLDQPQEESYISDMEKELYLFEADLFLMKRYGEYTKINESYIQETGETPSAKQEPESKPETQVSNGTGSISQKINTLISKINDSYTNTFASQIKFISDNKKIIMGCEVPSNWTIQKYDINLLSSLKVAAYDSKDADLLKDTSKYLDAKYNKFVGEGKSSDGNSIITDRITAKIYDETEQKYGDAERNDGYDFIVTGYKKGIEEFEDQLKSLEKKPVPAKTKDEKKATKESTMQMYFSEDATGDKEEVATNASYDDYFLINSRVLTVCMNIYIKNFKKQYAFLKKLYDINSKKK